MSSAEERLDAALAEAADDLLDGAEPTSERFRITNRDQFLWAMRRRKKVEDERREINEAARRQIERITTWQKEEERRLERDAGYFDFLLRQYFEDCRLTDPRLKTMKSPFGAVKARKQQPEFQLQNVDALVSALQATGVPHVVRNDPKPALSEIKALMGTLIVQVPIRTDEATGLTTYGLEYREVNEDGEVTRTVPLAGIVVQERPEAVSVKVDDSEE